MIDELQKEKIELAIENEKISISTFIGSFLKSELVTIGLLLTLAWPAYALSKSITMQMNLSGYHKIQPVVHPAAAFQDNIQILDAKALPILAKNYSAYALVKNPNASVAAANVSYTFHFLDSSGGELGSYTDTSSFLPSERKYLIAPTVHLAQPPASVRLDVSKPTWQKRIRLPNVVISTDVPVSRDSDVPLGFTIDGNITNQSIYIVNAVKVKALVFGAAGKIIAVTQTRANTLQPNEVRRYHLYFPVPLAGNMTSVKIYPETDLLDANNLKDPSRFNPAANAGSTPTP